MDYMEAIMVIPRSIISLVCLFIVTKIIGKRQVSELSLFDYVIGISIGNFIAEMIVNLDTQFIDGIVAMFTFGIISYVLNFLTTKSIHFRRILSGTPTIIINDGKLLKTGLKKANIDIHDLEMQARLNGYYNLSDIRYAIMESSGSISFLSNVSKMPVTKEDINLKLDEDSLTANIIIDGKYMKDAINRCNLNNKLIEEKYKSKNINSIDDILLGIYNSSNNEFTFYKKNEVTKNYSLIE